MKRAKRKKEKREKNWWTALTYKERQDILEHANKLDNIRYLGSDEIV